MPQLHGKTYFRLEHYLPVTVLDKVDQTTIKEELPKLHSNYYGASESEAEFEFLKVSKTRVNRNRGFRQNKYQYILSYYNTCNTLHLLCSDVRVICLFCNKPDERFKCTKWQLFQEGGEEEECD